MLLQVPRWLYLTNRLSCSPIIPNPLPRTFVVTFPTPQLKLLKYFSKRHSCFLVALFNPLGQFPCLKFLIKMVLVFLGLLSLTALLFPIRERFTTVPQNFLLFCISSPLNSQETHVPWP